MPQHPDSLELNIPDSPNPYHELMEKYEALLEVQRSSIVRKSNQNGGLATTNNCNCGVGISLAEEFQSSKIDHSNDGDNASSCNCSMTNDKQQASTKNNDKNRGLPPTEISEAETSSSGYSDETSNKGTQTDERPGHFLCSIGDGEDCKFSIYDGASPIELCFRNRPEYRELFKEIFAVLKKTAENKEESDKLPPLDDTHPNSDVSNQKVPPVTDGAQSIISSPVAEQSFAMTKLERKKHIIEKNQENGPPLANPIAQLSSPIGTQIIENGRILTPLKQEPLEYLAVSVGIKKKNRRKNRNFSSDRSESPLALPTPPRIFIASGKKRRDMRPYVESPMAGTPEQYNTPGLTKGSRPGTQVLDKSNIPCRPSTASQDLHNLKKLDLSYARVLKRADAFK